MISRGSTMKHDHTSRQWLAALSIGCFLACSGKLNVGQGTDQTGGTGVKSVTSGGTVGNGGTTHSGNSPGGASGGSSGATITKLGNASTCPATLPTSGDRCQLEGAACGYSPPPGSTEIGSMQCLCGERATGDLRWDCIPSGTSYSTCPASLENGASCFGHYSTWCSYPVSISCSCNQEPGVWECLKIGRPFDVPAAPNMPAPETPVDELGDADRAAWCQWFQDAVAGPGFPPREDVEVGADGKTQGGCAFFHGVTCNVALVELSPRQCAQNLAVSQCKAPIGSLTDCVTTAYNQCVPSPHGCARYIEAGCSGTIVSDLGAQGANPSGTGGASLGTAGTGTGEIPGVAGTGEVPGTAGTFGGATSPGESLASPCTLQVQ